MALTQEQRALLQLLLERDQSYEDISGLLGMDVGQVRRRARLSLIEIGGSDPDDDVALTDYLLGQADPIGRADVARHLRSNAEANALARKLAAQLQLLAPEAEIPEIPAGDERAAPAPPRLSRPSRPTTGSPAPPAGLRGPAPRRKETPERSGGPSSLTSDQRTLIAALLGAGVLILVIVLLATGAVGGDDDDSGNGEATATTGQTGDGNGGNGDGGGGGELTRAVLLPPDGGESPNGVAIFGRLRNTPVIQLTASGLDPPGEGENYSIWLYGDAEEEPVALLVSQVDQVAEDGRILIRFPIPAQALGFVANQTFDEIILSLTNQAEYEAEVEEARSANPQRLPRFTGEPVLRGGIILPEQSAANDEAG